MRCAHPVLAPPAVAAFPAGDYLLRYDAVPESHTPPCAGLLVNAYDGARELMTWYYLSFRVSRTMLVTPELHGTVIALDVAGADPDSLHLHQGRSRSRFRHRDLFNLVIVRAVAYYGLHELRHDHPFVVAIRWKSSKKYPGTTPKKSPGSLYPGPSVILPRPGWPRPLRPKRAGRCFTTRRGFNLHTSRFGRSSRA